MISWLISWLRIGRGRGLAAAVGLFAAVVTAAMPLSASAGTIAMGELGGVVRFWDWDADTSTAAELVGDGFTAPNGATVNDLHFVDGGTLLVAAGNNVYIYENTGSGWTTNDSFTVGTWSNKFGSGDNTVWSVTEKAGSYYVVYGTGGSPDSKTFLGTRDGANVSQIYNISDGGSGHSRGIAAGDGDDLWAVPGRGQSAGNPISTLVQYDVVTESVVRTEFDSNFFQGGSFHDGVLYFVQASGSTIHYIDTEASPMSIQTLVEVKPIVGGNGAETQDVVVDPETGDLFIVHLRNDGGNRTDLVVHGESDGMGGFTYSTIVSTNPGENGDVGDTTWIARSIAYTGEVIPEPASAALLAVGSVMLLRRRRAI